MNRTTREAITAVGLVVVALGALALGASAGVGGRTVEPDKALTRCEYAMAEWRQAGSPLGYPDPTFIDLEASSFCFDAMAWAENEGVLVGTGWRDPDPLPARAWTFAVERALADAADEYGISEWLLTEIVRCESSGDTNAQHLNTNGTIDYGLGQHNSAYISGRFAALGYLWATAWADPIANARVTAKLISEQGTAPYSASGHCSSAY